VDHRVEAAGGGAGEQAAAGVGDGHVGEPADADVEDGALGLAAGGERADHAERGQVDALELEPGLARRGDQAVDHLATDGHHDHARARLAGSGLDRAERLPVEDRLVHRHRDVIGRLHLDGGGQRLLVLQRRQVERADHDPLVRDAQPDAGRELVLGEERLQRVRERGDVRDLAVAQDAGAKGSDGAALERQRPVDGDLGGGDVAGIEIEADDRGL
jgi:hypothetical protein